MRRALLVATVMLAACAAPATESPSEASPPAPAPSPVDVAALSTAYAAMVETVNEVKCAANIDLSTGDLAASQQARLNVADALAVFGDALRDLEFPAAMQQMQDDMLQAVAAEKRSSRALGEATSVDEYNSLIAQSNEDESVSGPAGKLIREELGLPSPAVC